MRAALVLAAGSGVRMGGPKALLRVDGEALVARHVARFAELGCAPIVVVTRPELADEVRAICGQRAEVIGVLTASPAASLRAGWPRLGSAPRFVTPVDLVPPEPTTLRALLAALDDHVAAVTPQHEGRGGHPVLVRAGLLHGAPPEASLRTLLARLGDRRLRLPVDDPRVLGDLDEPADLSLAP